MAKYDSRLLEEEMKNKLAADWFAAFDTTRIIGKVDFCVAVRATELGLYEAENALWAEAKAGVRKDIHESFVQLTCGALGITPPTDLTTAAEGESERLLLRHPQVLPGREGRCEGQGEDERIERRHRLQRAPCRAQGRDETPGGANRA